MMARSPLAAGDALDFSRVEACIAEIAQMSPKNYGSWIALRAEVFKSKRSNRRYLRDGLARFRPGERRTLGLLA